MKHILNFKLSGGVLDIAVDQYNTKIDFYIRKKRDNQNNKTIFQ